MFQSLNDFLIPSVSPIADLYVLNVSRVSFCFFSDMFCNSLIRAIRTRLDNPVSEPAVVFATCSGAIFFILVYNFVYRVFSSDCMFRVRVWIMTSLIFSPRTDTFDADSRTLFNRFAVVSSLPSNAFRICVLDRLFKYDALDKSVVVTLPARFMIRSTSAVVFAPESSFVKSRPVANVRVLVTSRAVGSESRNAIICS